MFEPVQEASVPILCRICAQHDAARLMLNVQEQTNELDDHRHNAYFYAMQNQNPVPVLECLATHFPHVDSRHYDRRGRQAWEYWPLVRVDHRVDVLRFFEHQMGFTVHEINVCDDLIQTIMAVGDVRVADFFLHHVGLHWFLGENFWLRRPKEYAGNEAIRAWWQNLLPYSPKGKYLHTPTWEALYLQLEGGGPALSPELLRQHAEEEDQHIDRKGVNRVSFFNQQCAIHSPAFLDALVKAGVSPNSLDADGFNAYFYAMKNPHPVQVLNWLHDLPLNMRQGLNEDSYASGHPTWTFWPHARPECRVDVLTWFRDQGLLRERHRTYQGPTFHLVATCGQVDIAEFWHAHDPTLRGERDAGGNLPEVFATHDAMRAWFREHPVK
jgi:hypothetical protein